MAIYDNIRSALEVRLSNVSGIPEIAYENVNYSPTTDTTFVVPRMVPVSRRPAVRGPNPQKRYDGIFRVSCYVAEGNGPSAADDLANLVITAFDATTDISYTNSDAETIIVSIDYAERNEGRAVDNWYEVVVDIGWYIFAQ
jgi:hypothetical protein